MPCFGLRRSLCSIIGAVPNPTNLRGRPRCGSLSRGPSRDSTLSANLMTERFTAYHEVGTRRGGGRAVAYRKSLYAAAPLIYGVQGCGYGRGQPERLGWIR
jgi:hypothetical protein